MSAFLGAHRASFGVEPICTVLQIAPSGYRRHAAQPRDSSLRCARARRDDTLMPEIERVWRANLAVYGADKVWRQLKRESVEVARCTVERLMRRLGSCIRTSCWMRWSRRCTPVSRDVGSLIHPSDRGSQYLGIRYSERLAEAGVEPSVGNRGDSRDNAGAETINGLCKAELIHRRGPWKTREAVELATLEWVAWANKVRRLEPIGSIPPAEAEANHYRQLAEQAEFKSRAWTIKFHARRRPVSPSLY